MQRLISARTRTGAPLNMGLNCSDPAFPALLPLPCTQVLTQQNFTVPCTSLRLPWFGAGIKFSQVLGCPSTRLHLTGQKSNTLQIFRSRCWAHVLLWLLALYLLPLDMGRGCLPAWQESQHFLGTFYPCWQRCRETGASEP